LIAISFDHIYYVWGKYGLIVIKNPKESKFYSLPDIFAQYFKITHKAIDFDENASRFKTIKNGKCDNEFRDQSLIGCGAFGIVYKAIDKFDGKVYAIKKIALNEKEIQLVSKELDMISKLKSEFVVDYVYSWVEKNIKFKRCNSSDESISYSHPVLDPSRNLVLHIQMEFCFETLKEVKTQISLSNISPILNVINFYILNELTKEILESINFLHGRNPPIIHRDLKPANILISRGMNGRFVKLADFGLAVLHKFDDQSHTQETGTEKYMAPEVKEGRKYDTGVDVFSLGVILQELFNSNEQNLEKMCSSDHLFQQFVSNIGEKKGLELKSKFSKLIEFTKQMKNNDKLSRPSCIQLLREEKIWCNSPIEVKDVFEKARKCNKINEFHRLFMETKRLIIREPVTRKSPSLAVVAVEH
jgi:serine/threonine protein kinase